MKFCKTERSDPKIKKSQTITSTKSPSKQYKPSKTLNIENKPTDTLRSTNFKQNSTIDNYHTINKTFFKQVTMDELKTNFQQEQIKLCRRLKSKELEYCDNPYAKTETIILSPRNKNKTLNNEDEKNNDSNKKPTPEEVKDFNDLNAVKLNFIDEPDEQTAELCKTNAFYRTMAKTLGSNLGKTTSSSNNHVKGIKGLELNVPSYCLCYLCKGLIYEVGQCYKCHTNFCKKCLMERVTKYRKCPRCQQIISEGLIKSFSFEKDYEKIMVNCKYEGCNEKFNLNNIVNHVNSCVFKEKPNEHEEKDLKRYEAQFENDPYVKSKFFEYNKFVADTQQNLFTSLSLSNEEQSKRVADIQDPKHNKDNYRNEVEDINNIFSNINNGLLGILSGSAQSTQDTNTIIKNMLKNNSLVDTGKRNKSRK